MSKLSILNSLVLLDKDLTLTDLRVYGAICMFANTLDNVVFPKQKTIAERLGINVPMVSKSINKLLEKKYIEVEAKIDKRTGRKLQNIYIIKYDIKLEESQVMSGDKSEKADLCQEINCQVMSGDKSYINNNDLNSLTPLTTKNIKKENQTSEIDNSSYSEIPTNSTCKFSLQVEKKKKDKFIKPTLEEIIAFNEERNASVNCKKFFDYYDFNDWKDKNGNKVKNWKLKFINNWEKSSVNSINSQNNTTKDENESNLIEVKNNEINLFKNDSMNNIGLLNVDISLQEKEKHNNHYDVLFNFYKAIAKEEYVYENEAYLFKKYLSKDEEFKYHIQFIKTNKNLYFSTIKDIINNTKQDENLNKILSFIRKQMILFFDKEIKFDKDYLQKFLLKIESFNFICIHKIFTLNLTYLYQTRAENIKCSREGFVFLKYKEFFSDSNFNEKLNIFIDN